MGAYGPQCREGWGPRMALPLPPGETGSDSAEPFWLGPPLATRPHLPLPLGGGVGGGGELGARGQKGDGPTHAHMNLYMHNVRLTFFSPKGYGIIL